MHKDIVSNMGDEDMEQDERIVEMIGEDGTPVQFEHLMTLEHGESLYLLLTPAEPETPDEEGAVVIMRIDTDDSGEDCYVVEEDEEILESVFARFMAILEEDDGDEGEEDGEEE